MTDHEAINAERARKRAARKRRDQTLRRTYGISLMEYEAIFRAQGEVCAICGRQPPSSGRALHVDHDHRTGLVRGILCYRCNRGLPWFGDDPDTLSAAAEYIEHPPARGTVGRREVPKKKPKRRKRKTC